MKLVVLLGIMCVGLAVEVSAMNVQAGSNIPSVSLLGSMINRIQQIIVSFVQGLIASLTNTKLPSLVSPFDDDSSVSGTSGVRIIGRQGANGNNIVFGNGNDDDDDDDDNDDDDVLSDSGTSGAKIIGHQKVSGNNLVFGNNGEDDDDSSGFDHININGVDMSGNTGKVTTFSNIGNRGPPVANGATTKYGYNKVMTHIPTLSEQYGRIVKLEQKPSGINVILLREGGGISTYHHNGPIKNLSVKNNPDGVAVYFERNGKPVSEIYV